MALLGLRLKPGGHALQTPCRKAETSRIADGLQIVGKRHTRQTEGERRNAGCLDDFHWGALQTILNRDSHIAAEKEDGKGKAPAAGWAHLVGLIEILRHCGTPHAIRFYLNINDINDPRAIRSRKGR